MSQNAQCRSDENRSSSSGSPEESRQWAETLPWPYFNAASRSSTSLPLFSWLFVIRSWTTSSLLPSFLWMRV
jgi:hypothetical protein